MPTFVALLDIFTLPQDVTYSDDVDAVGKIDSLDPEETGFQSSFSKLGASEATVYSPVSQIKDEKEFASKEISTRSAQKPGLVSCATWPLTFMS
jgi:exportin-2 (importin alpha re-exporter)